MTATQAVGNKVNGGWSGVIRADTLESQIKRRIQQLQTSVKSPARFAGGDYQDAQQQFGQLATLFRIVHEFDANIRWQDHASAASVRCAMGSESCKSGDRNAFQRATTLRDDLTQLLQGGRFSHPQGASADKSDLSWDKIADRRGWMRWIEKSEQRLRSNVAQINKKSNPQAQGKISSDAQMLRVLARVLSQEEMEDGADEDYRVLCEQLATAAQQLESAVEQQDSERAATATKAIGQSCINCHESYKG